MGTKSPSTLPYKVIKKLLKNDTIKINFIQYLYLARKNKQNKFANKTSLFLAKKYKERKLSLYFYWFLARKKDFFL